MNYALFADMTAAIHFAIIFAVFVGLLISFRYKRFRPWETGAFLLIIVFWSLYGNCPLTIFEQWLRQQAGEAGVNMTSVGFLSYYADKIWGWKISSTVVQHSTFFSGATFFGASIEWFSPFFHREIFKFRKWLRRVNKIDGPKPRRRYA